MSVMLAMGIFWTLYGILGLLGLQVIGERYRGQEWPPRYIRCRGTSWLMIGLPWISLYLLTYAKDVDRVTMGLLMVVCALPAIAYSFVVERKYRRLL